MTIETNQIPQALVDLITPKKFNTNEESIRETLAKGLSNISDEEVRTSLVEQLSGVNDEESFIKYSMQCNHRKAHEVVHVLLTALIGDEQYKAIKVVKTPGELTDKLLKFKVNLKEEPFLARVLSSNGVAFRDQNQRVQSVAFAEAAVEAYPGNFNFLLDLFEAYIADFKFDKAKELRVKPHFVQASKDCSDSKLKAKYALFHSMLLASEGNDESFENAEKLLSKVEAGINAFKAQGKDVNSLQSYEDMLYERRAIIAIWRGDIDQAETILNNNLSLKNTARHLLLGYVAIHRADRVGRQYEDAVKHFETFEEHLKVHALNAQQSVLTLYPPQSPDKQAINNAAMQSLRDDKVTLKASIENGDEAAPSCYTLMMLDPYNERTWDRNFPPQDVYGYIRYAEEIKPYTKLLELYMTIFKNNPDALQVMLKSVFDMCDPEDSLQALLDAVIELCDKERYATGKYPTMKLEPLRTERLQKTYRHVIELYEENDYKPGKLCARAMLNAAIYTLVYKKNFNEVWPLLNKSLDAYRAIGDIQGEIEALNALATFKVQLKQFSEADDLLDQAIQLNPEDNDSKAISFVRKAAILRDDKHAFDEALDLLSQAETMFKSLQDKQPKVEWRHLLGMVSSERAKCYKAQDKGALQVCVAAQRAVDLKFSAYQHEHPSVSVDRMLLESFDLASSSGFWGLGRELEASGLLPSLTCV
jgi:tetratricopeptide (TPR) repeat protein